MDNISRVRLCSRSSRCRQWYTTRNVFVGLRGARGEFLPFLFNVSRNLLSSLPSHPLATNLWVLTFFFPFSQAMFSLKTCVVSLLFTLAFVPSALSLSNNVNDGQELVRRATVDANLQRRAPSASLLQKREASKEAADRILIAKARAARKTKRDVLLQKRSSASIALYTTYKGTKCATNSACVSAGKKASLPMNGAAYCNLTSRHCAVTCKAGHTLRENGTCTTTVVKPKTTAAPIPKTTVAPVLPKTTVAAVLPVVAAVASVVSTPASTSLYTTFLGTKCAANSACVAAAAKASLPLNGVASCDLTSRHCAITCKSGHTLRENGTCTTTVVKTTTVAAVPKTTAAPVVTPSVEVPIPSSDPIVAPSVVTSVAAAISSSDTVVVPSTETSPSVTPSPVVEIPSSSVAVAPAAAAAVTSAAKAFGGGITTAYAQFLKSKCATNKMCVNAQKQFDLPSNGIPACYSRYCIITCQSGYLLQSDGSCVASSVNCPKLANGIYTLDGTTCTPSCKTNLGYTLSGTSPADYKCTALTTDPSNCGSVGNACPPSYNGIGFAICLGGCNLQCPTAYYQYETDSGHYYCA